MKFKVGDRVRFRNCYYRIKTVDSANAATPYQLDDFMVGWVPESEISPAIIAASANTATKHDSEKLVRPELVDIGFIDGVSRALAWGAKHYDVDNWRKGFSHRRIFGALLRHLFLHMSGEEIDAKTGLYHLDCAGAQLMMLHAHFTQKLGTDDRVKTALRPYEAAADRKPE